MRGLLVLVVLVPISVPVPILAPILAPAATATTYTVCPDGSGDFLLIQDAVDVAVDGDTVELCCDAIFAGVGNRNIRLYGRRIIVCSACDDPTRCILDCEGSGRGFVFVYGEDADAQVAGVTITDGTADEGGAIYCSSSSPTFTNCILTRNETAAIDGKGGALFCWFCSPIFIDCHFDQNACTWSWSEGGAVACRESSPIFSGCTFDNNNSGNTGSGGAIYCEDASAPLFKGCTLSANESIIGAGAVACRGGSAAGFEDCIFRDNVGGVGGAILTTDSDAIFTRCTIIRNTATFGGGLAIENCAARLYGCTISHNTGEMFGGGIYCAESTPVLENTIISFSIAGESICLYGSGVPILTCCDFYGNEGGDWRWPLINQLEIEGNICADPCYCDVGLDDFQLWNYTPCNPVACGQIGAWPVGCWDPQGVEGEPEVHGDPAAGAARGRVTRLVFARVTPNPFSGSARIEFVLSAGADLGAVPVRVTIHDAAGRLCRTLGGGVRGHGSHALAWDGCGQDGLALGAGVYLCRLRAGEETVGRQVVVVR